MDAYCVRHECLRRACMHACVFHIGDCLPAVNYISMIPYFIRACTFDNTCIGSGFGGGRWAPLAPRLHREAHVKRLGQPCERRWEHFERSQSHKSTEAKYIIEEMHDQIHPPHVADGKLLLRRRLERPVVLILGSGWAAHSCIKVVTIRILADQIIMVQTCYDTLFSPQNVHQSHAPQTIRHFYVRRLCLDN